MSIPHIGTFRSGRRVALQRESTVHMPQVSQVVTGTYWGPDTGETKKQLSSDSMCIMRHECIPVPPRKEGACLHIILLSFTCCLQYWLYQALGVQTQESWAFILVVCKGVRVIQCKENPPVIGEGSSTDPSGYSRSQRSSGRESSVRPGRLPGRGRI